MTEDEKEPASEVNALNAGQKILDSFWALSSADQGKRNEAIQSLLAELTSASNREAVQGYVLLRLIKGLGSGRGACRQGFAAALAALLEVVQEITTTTVLQLLEENLPMVGSGKGTDQKNVLLGHLFTHAALAQAKKLTAPAAASSSISSLLEVSKKRSFLAEAATSVILDICDSMTLDSLQTVVASHEGLRAVLLTRAEDCSPEALLLALHLWPHLPPDVLNSCTMLPQCSGAKPPADLFNTAAEACNGKAPSPGKKSKSKKSLGNGVVKGHSKQRADAAAQFFTQGHLETLGESFKLSSASIPNLHSVWPHLLRLLLPQFTLKSPGKGKQERQESSVEEQTSVTVHVAALWTHAVEGHLLTSSHERKSVALQLFTVLLPHISASCVPIVLSKAFVGLLSISLKDSGSYLFKAAARCVDRMVEWAQNSNAASAELRAAVLFTLNAHSKTGSDGLHKLKAISRLSGTLDSAALQQYVQHLMPAFLSGHLSLSGTPETPGISQRQADEADAEADDEDNAEAVDRSRIWIMSQLCSVAQSKACSKATAVEVLRFLSTIAFVEIGSKGSKSKIAPVKLLASSGMGLSDDVRSFAVARVASLATDRLPCAAAPSAEQDEDVDGVANSKKPQNGEKDDSKAGNVMENSKKHPKQQHQARTCLVDEVSSFLDEVEAQAASRCTVLCPAACTDTVRQRLKNMLKACTEAHSKQPSVAGAQSLGTLLGVLRMVLCTDAADVAAGLVEDLYPVIAGALSVQLPVVEADSADAVDSDMQDSEGEGSWVHGFVSCLLSMLSDGMGSVPVAAFRTAIEASWRPLCVHADAVALGDLVEIVERVDRSVARAGDEMFEEPEEDGEQDDGDGDEDAESSESEDADPEEESDGEGQAGAVQGEQGRKKAGAGSSVGDLAVSGGRKRVREIQGVGSDGEDDEESEDSDEGLDDAAMFRLDKYLAQTFSTLKSGRQGAQAKAEAFQRFQLRALSLLEIWLKKNPRSSAVVQLPVPMLRALRVARRPAGNQALAKRVEVVLKSQVAAAKPAFAENLELPDVPDVSMDTDKLLNGEDDSGEEGDQPAAATTTADGSQRLKKLMDRVMYFATREKDKAVTESATAVYGMLLRAVIASAGAPAVAAVASGTVEGPSGASDPSGSSAAALCARQALDSCIKEVFEKKKTRWGFNELNSFIKRAPDVLPELLLPQLLDKARTARTEFLQLESLRLCSVCMRLCAKRKEAVRWLKLEDAVTLTVCHAVSAGYANMARRVDGLQNAATLFEGLKSVHDKQDPKEFCSTKVLRSLHGAVQQVEGMEGLNGKCLGQIKRLRGLLRMGQSKGGSQQDTKTEKGGDRVEGKRKRDVDSSSGAKAVKGKSQKPKKKKKTEQSQE